MVSFVMYKNIKSLRCTPKTNIRLYIYCNSIRKKLSPPNIYQSKRETLSLYGGYKWTNTTIIKWSRLISLVTKHLHYLFPISMQWRYHIISIVLLPKIHNFNLIMKKATLKLNLGNILHNNQLALIKNIKVMKDKETVKKCQRLEDTNDTQLNVLWDPWLNPGAEKVALRKKLVKFRKIFRVVSSNVPVFISWFIHCFMAL